MKSMHLLFTRSLSLSPPKTTFILDIYFFSIKPTHLILSSIFVLLFWLLFLFILGVYLILMLFPPSSSTVSTRSFRLCVLTLLLILFFIPFITPRMRLAIEEKGVDFLLSTSSAFCSFLPITVPMPPTSMLTRFPLILFLAAVGSSPILCR